MQVYGVAANSTLVRKKKLACFTCNLVQRLATENGQQMAKTKIVRKNANWRHSEAKG